MEPAVEPVSRMTVSLMLQAKKFQLFHLHSKRRNGLIIITQRESAKTPAQARGGAATAVGSGAGSRAEEEDEQSDYPICGVRARPLLSCSLP